MKKIRILAIAPYEGLSELMSNAAKEFPHLDFTILVSNMEAGVQVAQAALETDEYDIIVSRGGTARLIRDMMHSQQIDIPLIEIPITVGDMLQAIKLAENYQEKFAVVGFPNVTNHAKFICELMQYNLDIFSINNSNELVPLFEKLKEQNYSMVLCDVIASTVARENRLNAVLITSSFDSVMSAFEQSDYFSKILSRKKHKLFELEKLLENSPTQCYIFDKNDLIYTNTPKSKENELRIVKNAITAHNSQDRFEQQIGDKIYTAQTVDEEDLTFIYVDANNLISIPEESGFKIFSITDRPENPLQFYRGTSVSIGKVRNSAEAFSKNTLPVVICGEEGTGKDSVATYLYEHGRYSDYPFIWIDCDKVTSKRWKWLVESPDSPFSGTNHTIYFRDVNKLRDNQWSQLVYVLDNGTLCHCNRLIFSCIVTNSQNAADVPVCNYLLNQLSCLSLYLPPLRKRKEDIQSLATLYINQFNSELGNQIIGFEPEALSTLQNYQWPNNLGQFKRVLRELIIANDNFYIGHAAVIKCLKKESLLFSQSQTDNTSNVIDLNQNLDDITFDVVTQVLAQENGNQKKTAERLGVSRTTIWRITKNNE